MTREDFLRDIKKEYGIVKLLSAKNGGKTLVLKHNTLGKKIVLRLYRETIPLYDYLKGIKHKNLPLVFDTVPLYNSVGSTGSFGNLTIPSNCKKIVISN